MNLVIIMLLTAAQFLAGHGLLRCFSQELKAWLHISLSVLLGVAIFSIVPFLLQLFMIPLTAPVIFLSLASVTLALNLPFGSSLRSLNRLKASLRISVRLYEWPFLLLIGFIIFVSAWRCFYYPPTPRDLTSGAEVIAEYAVKEKTLLNSVFSINLESTNNQFKPPFITALQLIYKYAGFPFGQLWLSTIFLFFTIFLYGAARQTAHRLAAYIFLVILLAIPEMYAYTFMALFDYPNAVYFFLSCFFLHRFFDNAQKNALALSGWLMAIATYVRSETLILAGFLSVAIAWYHIRQWHGLKQLLHSLALFLVPSILTYLVSVTLYLHFYLPVSYDIEGQLNSNLFNIGPFFERFLDMNARLLFSGHGVDLYGYFIFIFLLIVILDHIWGDGFNRASTNWIFAVLVIYLGYPFMGYLLPLLDIEHSTKRGLFKIFPLMLLYMARSSVVMRFSEWLSVWEENSGKPVEKGGTFQS